MYVESWGIVWLRSVDLNDLLSIDLNYLKEFVDVEDLCKGNIIWFGNEF